MNERSFTTTLRRTLPADERRRQILDSALDAFSRQGYGRTTVREIAAAAGVAEGSIYNYFPSKRDLFVAVLRQAVMTDALLAALDQPWVGDDGFLRALFADRLRFIHDEQPRVRLLLAELPRDAELRRRWLTEMLPLFWHPLERYLQERMESGAFRQVDPAIVLRVLGGAIIAFALISGMAEEVPDVDPEAAAVAVADLLLYGLIERGPAL